MESDINKMNLSNLGMVFCSTLRIDRFCFNWLVTSWADCWAGCLTEDAEYQRSMPKRNPSNASSLNQLHSPQTPSYPQHPPHQRSPQMPSHEQSPPPPPPVSSSDPKPSGPIGQSVETVKSVDSGKPAELDGSQNVWPSPPNREKLVIPPLAAAFARKGGDMDGRRVVSIVEMDSEQAAHRERMEREREREQEREREREEALGIHNNHHDQPHNQSSHHKLVPSTDRAVSVFTDGDRYSTMVEPNKSPRQSIGSDCGRLGLPQSLPPIPPLSPMMQEGHNMV